MVVSSGKDKGRLIKMVVSEGKRRELVNKLAGVGKRCWLVGKTNDRDLLLVCG